MGPAPRDPVSSRSDENRVAATFAYEDIDDFFENAALSLHWVGPDGTILRANRHELDFLGYAREEYEGHHIAAFHVDRDVIEDILRRLAAGETLSDYEARLRAKDGSVKHVLINSNVRWVDGEFVHTRCFTRDITDRRQAEEALAEANRDLERKVEERTEELRRLVDLRDHFVATVSHELRTPLTSIAGFSVTMERYWDSLSEEDKREFMRVISEQSHRLTRLVDDLLIVARANSGGLDVRPEPIDLAEMVGRMLFRVGMTDVGVTCAPGLQAVADPDHLEQMVMNYLTNADKYGAPPVTVECRDVDETVEIRVRDHGRGVPDGFVPRLFEEFAVVPPQDGKTIPRGTGLGLSIVRNLARAQDGDAWHEPNEPHGAVFVLRLPRG